MDTISIYDEDLILPEELNEGYTIDKTVIESSKTGDVHQVLKTVPGVFVQEEEGHGHRPNIGLRGTHPHRSKKITLMEDGILIAPAPYSAPAAYYFPIMDNLNSIEVFKGPRSTKYGPNSIGGSLDLKTRSYFEDKNVSGKFNLGSYNEKSRCCLW